jgi:hypothetical protein
VATLIAAVNLLALMVGPALLALGFGGLRLWNKRKGSLPVAVAFYLGAAML